MEKNSISVLENQSFGRTNNKKLNIRIEFSTFVVMLISAREISEIVNGTVDGNPEVRVSKPSRIEEGEAGTISFLANPKYESYAYTTDASIILVDKDFNPQKEVSATMIRVDDVYSSVALLWEKFADQINQRSGIASTAVILDSVDLGEDVYVGEGTVIEHNVMLGDNVRIYPQVYIGPDVKIGRGTILHPGVRIYHGCEIGSDCIIHANTVIGSDGFGFAPQEDGQFKKVPQLGNVVVEDDVEIGSNCTIDRATMGSTIIRRGAKLDNLIQIAHNVEIGQNTAIAAQTGISGSTKIGKNCLIGGQVGFVGHIKIADRTQIQAQSGIAAAVEQEGSKLYGSPALPYQQYLKSYAIFRKLPDLYKRILRLERNQQDK